MIDDEPNDPRFESEPPPLLPAPATLDQRFVAEPVESTPQPLGYVAPPTIDDRLRALDDNDRQRASAMAYVRSQAPASDEVAAMKGYYTEQRDGLLRRVKEIEDMLGFVGQADDLAVRLAKIELFLGVKA